jgi:hypothetical protein
MSGASLLTALAAVWAAVTVVFIVLMIWKTFVGMKEEDSIVLDEKEAAQARAKEKFIEKMQRITLLTKRFGLASLALLVVTGALWIYRGVTVLN